MKLDKSTVTLLITIITALAGLGTALINRYTPNTGAVQISEDMSRKSYRVMKQAMGDTTEDVGDLSKRVDMLEQSLIMHTKLLQSLHGELNPNSGRDSDGESESDEDFDALPDLERRRVSRRPKAKRGSLPTFDAVQRAR